LISLLENGFFMKNIRQKIRNLL